MKIVTFLIPFSPPSNQAAAGKNARNPDQSRLHGSNLLEMTLFFLPPVFSSKPMPFTSTDFVEEYQPIQIMAPFFISMFS